jgi:hypothetical protein
MIDATSDDTRREANTVAVAICAVNNRHRTVHDGMATKNPIAEITSSECEACWTFPTTISGKADCLVKIPETRNEMERVKRSDSPFRITNLTIKSAT